MASGSSVWGIEIGQSALKALRCHVEDEEVIADAFDYIEYTKILSQPEAVAEELIADALAQFMERNEITKERVCISVPGQSGLAKFFKPPPVEVKKIADIVRYEARQQIPFDLDDVSWGYQMMPGSMIEEGYALDSEVGLFAMKREQAYRQLAPFDDANVEVDVVQLAPVALYNMVAYDRMGESLDADMFDADNPPPSSVVLSIGTDSSDLIVTNGFRIWQRSMPIGGNHFTRQLTKDLKLTFAKAEHLKRNAREAVDPKLVFQTMRPVFSDLVTEVQRSIGFFRSIDKRAEIADLIVTGNTVKMPGLAQYLGKNLGFEVHVLDRFNRLGGSEVLSIPTFRDNIPTFGVCYGLCLQGLGIAQISASLVPQEILTKRLIRAKKPWALAGIAALLLGMTGHYFFTEKVWYQTRPAHWLDATSAVKQMASHSTDQKSRDDDLEVKRTYLEKIGEHVAGDSERRLKWLEIIKVINSFIPRGEYPEGEISAKDYPFKDRPDIHITQIDSKHFDNLATFWTVDRAKRYRDDIRDWAEVTDNKGEVAEKLLSAPGPKGAGWVFELHGYHYFNDPDRHGQEGNNHIRRTLTTKFLSGTVKLPVGDQMMTFTPQEMGLSFPMVLENTTPKDVEVPNPDYDEFADGKDSNDKDAEKPTLTVKRLDFIYQVIWQENTLSERIEAKKKPAGVVPAVPDASAGKPVAMQ